MKQLSRWLFHGLAALSLLVGLFTLTLMFRSRSVGEAITCGLGLHRVTISSSSQNLSVYVLQTIDAKLIQSPTGAISYSETILQHRPGSFYSHFSPRAQKNFFHFDRLTLPMKLPQWKPGVLSQSLIRGTRGWELVIPDWAILIVAGLVCALWWRYGRRTLQPPGCCDSCGYDLRATPDRCPECGKIPAKTGNISI